MDEAVCRANQGPARLIAAAAALWAGVLPAAAFGVHAGGFPWAWLVPIVYGAGHFVCHQRPERSFSWGAAAWPVCARCAGIYAGAAIGALAGCVVSANLADSPARVRIALALAAAPACATLLYEWSTGDVPSNAVRAATGIVAGIVSGVLVTAFVRTPAAGAAAPEVN